MSNKTEPSVAEVLAQMAQMQAAQMERDAKRDIETAKRDAALLAAFEAAKSSAGRKVGELKTLFKVGDVFSFCAIAGLESSRVAVKHVQNPGKADLKGGKPATDFVDLNALQNGYARFIKLGTFTELKITSPETRVAHGMKREALPYSLNFSADSVRFDLDLHMIELEEKKEAMETALKAQADSAQASMRTDPTTIDGLISDDGGEGNTEAESDSEEVSSSVANS